MRSSTAHRFQVHLNEFLQAALLPVVDTDESCFVELAQTRAATFVVVRSLLLIRQGKIDRDRLSVLDAVAYAGEHPLLRDERMET